MEESQVKKINAELARLRTFVPSVVRDAVGRNPECPLLDRHMRDLSVLFMDIAGCTRLCETLPPGRMQELTQEFFSSFIDELYELGGTINETAGDGLMILFLHEDPEEHAVAGARAASLIHRRTREFAICWGEECKELAVHIGINSGGASLGVLEFRGKREIRATYTASGPVTNIAARLAALAPGGKTYIGAETWKRVKGFFLGTSVGQVKLKNVSQPIEIFDLGSDTSLAK